MEYKDHPLSQLLPLMNGKDLSELAADIKQNGLRAPITLLDDQILDGRNRHRACKIVGVEPKYRTFNGDGDPLAFIISANVKRRHLTIGQRAMVAAKLAKMPKGDKTRFAESAKTSTKGQNAQDEGETQFSEGFSQRAILPSAENKGKSIDEVAQELEVSRRSVVTAKQVLKTASPEDVEAVERGEKKLETVAKETRKAAQAKDQHLDKTGFPIPDSILEDWQRATETARQLLSQISNIRSDVKHALEEQDIIYAEVNNSTIADLTNAYTSLKCVVPYAVCSSCQGHHRKKCALCRGRGFISEFAWRSFVPSEIKKIRGKQ